jgi:hypothetical protein
MSKSSAPDPNDHWRRLAAELGLEMEPAPAGEPEPEPEPVSSPSHAEPAGEELEPPPDTGIWTTESHQFEELRPAEAPTLEDLPVAEYDHGDPAPAAITELDDGTEESEKPRRRRRRSRRKKGEAPVAAEGAAERDEPTAEPMLVADEDDDSTAELVKDWNIPSWNDLIASLHRPDR